MKRILFVNDLRALKKHMAEEGDTESLRYIVMDDGKEALEIKDYLSGAMHLRGITRREMLRRLGEDFKREFSKAVLDINTANNSVEWWAMNFTSKLPAMSKLYENAFYFASVKTIIADIDGLIVVSESTTLRGQLKEWSARAGVKLTSVISPRFNLKRVLSRHTPAIIIYMFLKIASRKLLSVALLKTVWPAGSNGSVIVTQFEDRSIGHDGMYRDIYLPGMKDLLPDLDSMRPKASITVGFSPYNFVKFIFKLARRKENAGIYPMEHYLSMRELSIRFALSLKRFFRPVRFNGSFRICGEDASSLVSEEIIQSVSCGQFLLNLSAHASMLSFSKISGVRTLYYPFENRSWEKMVILAFRKNSPLTKIMGYQHTVIGPRHLCYFMERDEFSKIPMPDIIVTDGEITKNIMMDWNFPESMLRAGPALRFAFAAKAPASDRRVSRITNILVPLTTGLDEYVKMFMFLEKAFNGADSYNIVIRPHPTVSFDKVFRIFTPSGLRYRISDSVIEDDLANCDLVLYAASTVSLEAMAMGKPVIHIELDDYIDSDPIFDMNVMKWNCSDPAELIGLIRSIDSLDGGSIERIRIAAAEYIKKYFYPVNRENLAAFLP